MRRLIGAVAAVALAIPLLVGCSTDAPGDEEKTYSDEINISLISEAANFDPHATNQDESRAVSRQIFETLVTLNANREIAPMLAESVEEKDGGATIVFKLRDGVLFHDGTEVDAYDAEASLKRWAQFSAVPEVVKAAEFVAVDDLTVEMRMEFASALALPAVAKSTQYSAIMPKEIAEAAGEEPISEYVGTGPWKWSEWRTNQYVELEKFEDYVSRDDEASGLTGKKEALAQTLRFHFVSDPATQLAGIQTGEYDIVHNMTLDYYSRVQSDPELEARLADFGAHLVLYNRHPESIFNDVRIRQAVNVGLDAAAVRLAVSGEEDFIGLDPSFASPDDGIWHTNAGSEHYNQADPERAKQMLEQAGYAGEEVVVLTFHENTKNYNTAIVLVEQLKGMGINAILDVYDQATALERRQDPTKWDLYPSTFAWADTPLGMTFMRTNFIGGPFDEKILSLRDQMAEAPSIEDARGTWAELQAYLWEYLVATKFGNDPMMIVVSNKVEGFTNLDGAILWNTRVIE